MSTVADVMIRDLQTVSPTASVQDAAQRMRANNIGSLPVTVESRLVGTITDRDITVRVIAEGRDPSGTLVRDAMTTGLFVIHPEQDLSDAEALMKNHQIRRLPVVETGGRLVGYVTMATIAREEADEKAVGRMLKGIFQPRKRDSERFSPKARSGAGG
jgi:CBS domain-containing protein